MSELRIAGAVLAGGRSRRMGCPKEHLCLDGAPLLVHQLTQLAAAGLAPLLVSARSLQQLPVLPAGVHVVPDRQVDNGPLEAIGSLLAYAVACSLDAVLVLPCDVPAVPVAAIRQLHAAFCREPSRVVYVEHASPARRFEPLCGVVPVSMRHVVDQFLHQGGRRVADCWHRCGAATLALGSAGMWANMNTPEDWTEWTRAPRT